jgi:hypothetical protein
MLFPVDGFGLRAEYHPHETAIDDCQTTNKAKGGSPMKRQLLTVLLLLALSSLALGQAILPMPNLVDHQTTTDNGSTTFTFTDNIASAYNILYLVVTCDLTNYEAGQSGLGCGAALTPPVDSNTPRKHLHSNRTSWQHIL